MSQITPTGCTPALLSVPLSADEALQLAALFRALGDPARLQLLSFIAAHPAGEACVCELTNLLELSQPTTSHHLKVLFEAGLLSKERRGTWVYYKVVPEMLGVLLASLLVSPASHTGLA